ncbi:unnamed protein product [Rhizophagus irregularis]|nr:unnamed protein product [Rhizophagus irregularis]
MTPMTPMTPLTPLTPIIQIQYNPSKISISSPSSSSQLHEMEILQPNDNWKFSILTTNTLNSTISSSPSPTLHDGDSYLDGNFDNINIDNSNITNFV